MTHPWIAAKSRELDAYRASGTLLGGVGQKGGEMAISS